MAFLRLAGIIAGFGALAACSSSGGSGGVSIDDITKAGNACPVKLAAGAQPGQPTQRATASVEAPDPDSPLGKTNGVAVDCGLALGGDRRLDLTLVASPAHGVAANVLLPAVQRSGELSLTQLQTVAATAAKTKPGRLVPLPGTGPVALAIVDVKGAKSAAFVLSGEHVPRSAVETVAQNLARSLG